MKKFFRTNKSKKGFDEIGERDYEFTKYHEERFAELPNWIIDKAMTALYEVLSREDIETIKQMIEKDPIHWIAPHHFFWGMRIRNLFREKVCLDDQLPGKEEDKNWDNFYTQLIEVFVGKRENPYKSEEL